MKRLTQRKDFLAAAGALRASVGPFLLQGRERRAAERPAIARYAPEENPDALRVGFTVTKKHGNAVERNRMRRRLRAAACDVLPRAGRDGFDYVIVARRAVLSAPYADLVQHLERAVARLHAGPNPGARSRTARARAPGDASS